MFACGSLSLACLAMAVSWPFVEAVVETVTLRSDSRQVLPREPVAQGELRVTVMGSGMPYTRRAQASASFLVQLGDPAQSTFLFDVGSGAMANVNAAGIDYARLNTVFLTHYHVDHTGDLPALFGGGMVMGRQHPLRIFGPSGDLPEHGLHHFCMGLRHMTQWDIDSRRGRVPSGGSDILDCHEFDYTKVNQTVYAEGDVLVTASPVVHIIGGPVAYRLDWRGLSFVFSGDTKPTSNMIALAKGADIFVHEGFVPPSVLAHAMQLNLENAKHIVEHIHTPLKSAGSVFALSQPRLAVVYHLWLDLMDMPSVVDEVRKTYTGPLAIADDLMVFEAHKAGVRQRQQLLVDRPFPLPDRSSSAHSALCDDARGEKAACEEATSHPEADKRLDLPSFLVETELTFD